MNILFERGVHLHGRRMSPLRPDFVDDRLRRLTPLDISRHHIPAALRREFRCRRTDAAAAAGDDQNFVHVDILFLTDWRRALPGG